MPDEHSKTSDPAVGSTRLLACARCGGTPAEHDSVWDAWVTCQKCFQRGPIIEQRLGNAQQLARLGWNEAQQANDRGQR
jgi:hypothetical protein